jgi:hypothetical protein
VIFRFARQGTKSHAINIFWSRNNFELSACRVVFFSFIFNQRLTTRRVLVVGGGGFLNIAQSAHGEIIAFYDKLSI